MDDPHHHHSSQLTILDGDEFEDPAAVITDKDDANDDDDDSSGDDEEAGPYNPDTDPYVYSDDSASLSDAYFFPTDDEMVRPLRYREQDPFHPLPINPFHHPHYPLASYYGSMNPASNPNNSSNNNSNSNNNSLDASNSSYQGSNTHSSSANKPHHYHHHQHLNHSASPPLWVAGSIAEDGSEDFSKIHAGPPHHQVGGDAVIADASSRARKERRRQRRLNRELRLKQQQQAARERAVCQIRGQPQQVTTWQDAAYAILFVTQLIVVVVCAIVFGMKMIQWNAAALEEGDSIAGRAGMQTALSGGIRRFRFLADLWHNATTGQIQYQDDSVSNRDAPDVPLHVRVPSSIIHTDAAAATSANSDDSSIFDFTFDYENVVSLVGITGFYACIFTYISFGFMLILARALIQVMLVFSILMSLAWGIIGLTLDPYGVISVMGFAALLLTLGYTMYNWNRIPFAATNLHTALSAIRCTADITILCVISLLVAFGWCMVWSTAFVGIVNAINAAECNQKDACEPHLTLRHTPLYLLLLFSFYWTHLVIRNVVRVTVASAIGTWWFRPQDIGPFCTYAVRGPLMRSMTTSLGSICLASLVIAPAQWALAISKCFCCSSGCGFHGSQSGQNSDFAVLTAVAQAVASRRDSLGSIDESVTTPTGQSAPQTSARFSTPSQSERQFAAADQSASKANIQFSTPSQSERELVATESSGVCRRLCRLSNRVGHYLRSCNRWSFAYIGMYGYSFHEAGERAIQLFETREWLDVVGDNLIQNVLLMASMVIGGSTGTFAVVVEETDGYYFSSFHMPTISAFLIGSALGFVLSNVVLLGVVGSAVNTVLVCFAAGPFEFDKNHPRLSREMREVWSQQVWEPAE